MKSLGRGAFYITLSNLFFMLSGYLTNVWLARHFGPHVYGQYSVLLALMTIISIIQNSGPPQALTRLISQNIKDAKLWFLNGLVFQLIATLLIALIVIIFSPSLANFINEPGLTNTIKLLALVFPIYGLFVMHLGYYSGLHEFGKQAFISTIYAIAKLIFVIVLAYEFGVSGAVLGFVLAPLLGMLGSNTFPKENINKDKIKVLAFKSFPLTLFAIVTVLQLSVDLIAVKKLLPVAAAAGLYAACQNIALIPYYGLSSISNVVFPGITKHQIAGNLEQTRNIISSSLRYQYIILVPTCLFIAAISRQILVLLFGDLYATASSALSLLMIGYIFLSLFMLAGSILNALSKSYSAVAISATGVITTIVLCWLLIPKIGIQGAALSVGIASFMIFGAAYGLIFHLTKFKVPIISIVKVTFFSILGYLLLKFLQPSIFLTPLAFIFCSIIYVLLLIASKELNAQDINLLLSTMPGVRKSHEKQT
jgi:O-antigen/teichoic acid export membrane protein